MIYSNKRFVVVLMLIITLIVIGIVLSQTLLNPFGSTCPPLIETALNELDQCGRIGINTTCYGYNRVEAKFNQPVPIDYFTQQGDIAQVNEVDTLRTAPYDPSTNEWGVALMRVQANIPNTLPGQGVVFVLMGDTTVENAVDDASVFEPTAILSATNTVEVELRSGDGLQHNAIYLVPANSTLTLDAINPTGDWVRAIYQDATSSDPKLVDGQFGWIPVSALNAPVSPNSLSVLQDTPHTPMQAFYFETGIGNAACKEAPNTLVVQGPENLTVDLNVNGMNVSLSSMLALQAPLNGETRFICVVGPCTLQLENEPEQILETFEQVFCPHQSNVEVGTDEGIGNNVVESCNPKESIDPQDVIELIVLDEIYANVPDLLNYDPEVVKNIATELNLDAEGLLNLIEIIREQTPQPISTTSTISGGFILPTPAVTPTSLTPTPDITLTPIFPTPQPTVVSVSSPEASPTPDTVVPVANDDSGNLQIGTTSSNNILSNDTGNPAPVVISFGGSAPSNVSDHLANGIDVYSQSDIDVTISSSGVVNVDATYATGEGTITLYYRIQNSVGTDDGQITLNYGTMPIAVSDTYSTSDTNALSVMRHILPNTQTIVELPSRLLFRPFPSMRLGGPMNLLFNDTLGSPVASLYSFGGLNLGGTEASYASGSNVAFLAAGTSAMLHANSDGSFALTNPPFNIGTWQFKYKLKNTLNSSVGTVTIHVYRAVDAVPDGNGTVGFYVVPIGETISSGGSILGNDIMGIPEGSLYNYGSPPVTPGNNYTFAAGAGSLTVSLATNGNLTSLSADAMATPGVYPFPYQIANSYGGDTANVYVSVIEETNPAVANITPYNGETLVASSTNITIAFSDAVNLSNFSLNCNGVIFNTSNTTVTGNGTTSIVIDPTGTLPYGQTCNLTIETNQVTDVDTFDPPDGLASRYNSSFTTRAQPIITTVNPANNSNISTTDTVTVTFDQTVTFDPSVVTVVCDSIAQTFTPNTTQTGVNSITFTPSPTWSVGVCTFTIPANAFVAPSAGAGNSIYTFNAS